MINKKALIIGSEGQDGTLLKQLLNKKKYVVWGIGRNSEPKVNILLDKYIQMDLAMDIFSDLTSVIKAFLPDEIYYIAAFHHSSQEVNFEIPSPDFINMSVKVNQISFIHLLEIVRCFSPITKVLYTSTSLIYAGSNTKVQDEDTLPAPRCIYSLTKIAAMGAASYYRDVFGIFVSVAIMYNHESIYRGEQFLSKRIIRQTQDFINKKRDKIIIGDLHSITDWGYAPDYVEALWHMIQLSSPDNYIVSSGKEHKVQDWFDVLSKSLHLDWTGILEQNKKLITRKRTTLIGNHAKLAATGWQPKVTFDEMVMKIYYNKL